MTHEKIGNYKYCKIHNCELPCAKCVEKQMNISKMTLEKREAQYVKETGDKFPKAENFKTCIAYDTHCILWYKGFISWLSARLEKAEKENMEMKDLIIAGNWERLCDLYNNFNQD